MTPRPSPPYSGEIALRGGPLGAAAREAFAQITTDLKRLQPVRAFRLGWIEDMAGPSQSARALRKVEDFVLPVSDVRVEEGQLLP